VAGLRPASLPARGGSEGASPFAQSIPSDGLAPDSRRKAFAAPPTYKDCPGPGPPNIEDVLAPPPATQCGRNPPATTLLALALVASPWPVSPAGPGPPARPTGAPSAGLCAPMTSMPGSRFCRLAQMADTAAADGPPPDEHGRPQEAASFAARVHSNAQTTKASSRRLYRRFRAAVMPASRGW